MADLNGLAELASTNGHLAVVATVRGDGTVQASLVNAGVSTHPVTGQQVFSFVAIGGGAKLANLRKRPSVAATFHHGWQWITVEGTAELAGPDDTALGLSADQLADVVAHHLHRRRRHPRRLAGLRRNDGPGTTRGGAGHPHPDLQQSAELAVQAQWAQY